jgi:hypothetical protein
VHERAGVLTSSANMIVRLVLRHVQEIVSLIHRNRLVIQSVKLSASRLVYLLMMMLCLLLLMMCCCGTTVPWEGLQLV